MPATHTITTALTLTLALGAPPAISHSATAAPTHSAHAEQHHSAPVQHGNSTHLAPKVRFATFNASLNRRTPGGLIEDLRTPANAQAQNVAEIIQRNQPDVLLVNEFDYDADHQAATLFRDNYLAVSQNGATPAHYPYLYLAPVNTGVPSGVDLNGDGSIGGPADAFGFGFFPGQYGQVVYSKYPIDTANVRTFQKFLWKDQPGALLPSNPATETPGDWYSPAALDVFRLSSKSHWDIPITINGHTVHFLTAHPTPPVFDGPEDRNGRRNHDEIRFWADYVQPEKAHYIYDDTGQTGGLPANAHFVIAGDLNADPHDGDSVPGAINQLTDQSRIVDPFPRSTGGPHAARTQGGANTTHRGNPAYDTADFSDRAPGNLRVDYVLPSSNLAVINSAVYWPAPANPFSRLTGNYPFPASDHRLVRVDVIANPIPANPAPGCATTNCR